MTGKILIDWLPENSDIDMDIIIKCKRSDYNQNMTIENFKQNIENTMSRAIREIQGTRDYIQYVQEKK